MSDNLDDLRAQLDALNQIRHGGEAEVTYLANGVQRRVRYRSYDELVRAIADLENRIIGSRARNIPVRMVRGWERGATASGREHAETFAGRLREEF